MFISEFLLPLALFWFFYFIGRAIVERCSRKRDKVTSFKANPISLYPSYFFDVNSEKIAELETIVAGSTAVGEESQESISASLDQLVSQYSIALKRKDLSRIKQGIHLCKRAIELERQSFLTDNGRDAVDFIFNRQNHLTDYLLTGVTVPMLAEAISSTPATLNELCDNIRNNWVLGFTVSVFLVLLGYRIFKYAHNKHSMMKSNGQVILYNKAELMLACFERAVEGIENNNQQTK